MASGGILETFLNETRGDFVDDFEDEFKDEEDKKEKYNLKVKYDEKGEPYMVKVKSPYGGPSKLTTPKVRFSNVDSGMKSDLELSDPFDSSLSKLENLYLDLDSPVKNPSKVSDRSLNKMKEDYSSYTTYPEGSVSLLDHECTKIGRASCRERV